MLRANKQGRGCVCMAMLISAGHSALSGDVYLSLYKTGEGQAAGV